MDITYYTGPDLPYESEPKEYITVNGCDLGRHTVRGSSRQYITLREKGRADYYLLYVLKGRVVAEFDGEELQAFPGDVIVYYPHVPQKLTYHYDDKTDNYWIHFTGYAIPEILKQSGFDKSGVFRGETRKVSEECFMKIMNAQKTKSEKIHINAIFMQLMDSLSVSRNNAENDTASNKVLRAIMQLSWERRSPKKIPHYAAMCGMSVSRFSVVFKEATGKTPTSYLEELRMEDARELIEKTTLLIYEIAANIGYDDALYFSRIFRKHYGISPTEYRKQIKGNHDRP